VSLLKKVAARMPDTWQTELKRIHFQRKIRKGEFSADEPEYDLLDRLVRDGDWAVDVGANVGQYTQRLSDLVGPSGRVLAFEPVPATFSLLSANVGLFRNQNVSLFNAAVSDSLDVVGMSMPKFDTGLNNYYQAHISDSTDAEVRVLTLSLDALGINRHISLVKIDAEGHEASVLAGMRRLIESCRPVLIVETGSPEVISGLQTMGYQAERLPGSPNVLFRPSA